MSLNRDYTSTRNVAFVNQMAVSMASAAPSADMTIDTNWPGMLVLDPQAAINLVLDDTKIQPGTVFYIVNKNATNAISVMLGATTIGTVAANSRARVLIGDGEGWLD